MSRYVVKAVYLERLEPRIIRNGANTIQCSVCIQVLLLILLQSWLASTGSTSTVLGLGASSSSRPLLLTCMDDMMASSASTCAALKWRIQTAYMSRAFHLPFDIYRFHGQICHATQKKLAQDPEINLHTLFAVARPAWSLVSIHIFLHRSAG